MRSPIVRNRNASARRPAVLDSCCPKAGKRRSRLSVESLEARRVLTDLFIPTAAAGSIHGTKWEDVNADSVRGADEPGLAGVFIYLDTNANYSFDADEPSTITAKDDPATREDETGTYSFSGLKPGEYLVREIVPDGFVQTYPRLDVPVPPPGGPRIDGLPIFFPYDGHIVTLNETFGVRGVDFGNHRLDLTPGSASGFKWLDANGNGQRDGNEPGLEGVVIFADLDWNGLPSVDEPQTRTTGDVLDTAFDETGFYDLPNLPQGSYMIREVVPVGYRQTYPGPGFWDPFPIDPPIGIDPPIWIQPADGGVPTATTTIAEGEDPLASVIPERIDVRANPGTPVMETVAITVHPTCIRAVPMDVKSSSPNVLVENITGQQVNGCGGDTSKFQVAITSDGTVESFEIQFFDAESGSIYGTIPVTIWPGFPQPGNGHLVFIQPGTALKGLDFGNAKAGGGSIQGRKWLDRNANGKQEVDEPGLGGVVIYLDLDQDGRQSWREPSVTTQYDNPVTDFDEAGLYSIDGLYEGTYMVREVVPYESVQTFPGPGGSVVSSETVTLNPGKALDLDVTGITVSGALDEKASLSAKIDLTAVFPDSCGVLVGTPSAAVLGNHIIVSLTGAQTDGACLEVITSRTTSIEIGGLSNGQYAVFASMQEVTDPGPDLTTLSALGTVMIGTEGGHLVKLGKDETLTGFDFGNKSLAKPGEIRGLKWLDSNANGLRDESEKGLPGVVIYLDANQNGTLDAGELSVKSSEDDPNTKDDESGRYAFTNVDPGYYFVREEVPAGYEQTFPRSFWMLEGLFDMFPDRPWPWPGDGGHAVYVTSGGVYEGLDFGNAPILEPGFITGTKWIDSDGDGQRTSNEKGLPNVVIFADSNLNGQFDFGEAATRTLEDDPSTNVDESGTYRLEVRPGEHLILEQSPRGYVQSYPSIFRKIRFPYNLGHGVTVEENATVVGVDFGNRPLPADSAVTGAKWIDENGDGKRDPSEPGLAGVVIYADLNGNRVLDGDEPQTLTRADDPATDFDETGQYQLTNLFAGAYAIREVVPLGMVQTFPAFGGASIEAVSDNLPPGQAIDFALRDVQTTFSADGMPASVLTFSVVWPSGCGQILEDATKVTFDGQHVHVEAFGIQTGQICTLALKNDTFRVPITGVPLDSFTFDAILWEGDSADANYEQSFVMKGRASLGFGGSDEHRVELNDGETLTGLDFGNRRDRLPPSPMVADIDQDGKLSAEDIDLFAAALRTGVASTPYHDFSNDGKVDEKDLEYMVHDLMKVRDGDANMDGQFNSADLVMAFQAGKYESDTDDANWTEGDWNGDGQFDSADLVAAFQGGGYEAN